MIAGYRLKTRLNKIAETLDAERQALLTGDIREVIRLTERRTELIDTLLDAEGLSDEAHREALDQIQKKARRNATLLKAAQEGMRSAETILTEITTTQSKLGTYDETGKIGATTVAKPRHERRA